MPYWKRSVLVLIFGLNYFVFNMVGAGRFERPTPCAQGRCATRLRYAPTSYISDSKPLLWTMQGPIPAPHRAAHQPWRNSGLQSPGHSRIAADRRHGVEFADLASAGDGGPERNSGTDASSIGKHPIRGPLQWVLAPDRISCRAPQYPNGPILKTAAALDNG